MARRIPFRLAALAACFVASLSFYACSTDVIPPTAIEDETEHDSATNTAVDVVSIELSPTRATLGIGSELRIEAAVYGSGNQLLTGQAVRYTSDRPGVATVEGDGLVSAVGLGAAVITAEVGGVMGSVAVTVAASGTPTVSISAPADRTRHARGATISFEGTADDAEDGPLTGAALVWTSDRDGFLGEGSPLGVSTLALGDHTITLTATDSDGGTGSASIRIAIFRNGPPTVAITAPADGAVYKQGDPIDFMGVGSDPEDGNLVGSSLEWSSDLDGPLGTGANITISNLSVGDHVITLTGTDSRGVSATAHIDVTVTPSKIGETPIMAILDPGDRTIHQAGQAIDFLARAFDPEDGNLTGGSVVWTSDKDGVIGTGNPLSTSALSLGDHSITVTGTDSNGNSKTSRAIRIAVVGSQPQKIWVRAGSGTSISVQEGSGLGIPIHVDMSMANGADLASLTFEVTWDPQVLDYNSAAPGTFGSVTFNETGVANGILVVSLFNATGTTSSFDAVTIDYTAASAGMTDVTPMPTAAGNENGSDITGIVMGDDLKVTVTPVSQPMDPMADAGPDQTVTDSDDSGDEQVQLDGTGSSDSDGTIVSYVWTEGGNQIATGPTPTVTFLVGHHDLVLTVTDDDGLTDTDMVTITVDPKPLVPPTADAGPDQHLVDTDGSGDEQVQLDGTGSSDSDGTIVSYSWTDTSDNVVATGPTPIITLPVGGHQLTLTVTDDDGAMGIDAVTIIVDPKPVVAPTADAGGPYTGTTGQPVQFDGTGSTDDGTIVSYNWDFGDGNAGTGPTPTHTYQTQDDYQVCLTVTDDDNQTDTDCTTADIDDPVFQEINVRAGDGGSASVQVGQVLAVPMNVDMSSANGADLASITFEVTWDAAILTYESTTNGPFGSVVINESLVGSGILTVSVFSPVGTTASFPAVTVDYRGAAPGTDHVTPVTTAAGDENGNDIIGIVLNDDLSVTVTAQPNVDPVADAGGPYTGDEGQPVQFDGTGSTDDGTIVSYDWDFGDGNMGSGATPTHTYAQAGQYTVMLTVTDDLGAMDTDQTTADIAPPPNPDPVADAGGPYTGDEGQPVQFDGTGSTDDGTIVSYDWDFGDGNMGSGATPTHTYAQAGQYTVMLTVTDDLGAMDTDQTTADIAPPPNPDPVADAGGPYTGDEGQPVQFDGTGSTDDGTIVSYDWDFGDGNMGSGATPTHTYAQAGQYTVMLTVTDDLGAMDTDQTTADIAPPPNPDPVADAGGPYTGDEGQPVQFDGTGSTDDGTIVSYDWDFGDGNMGSGATPTHTYAQAGQYTVTLTVTDDDGAMDTDQTTADIAPPPPPSGIVLQVGDGTTTSVGAGTNFRLPFNIDMSGANGENLASLTFEVSWDPASLSFTGSGNATRGSTIPNTTNAANGVVQVSWFDFNGATADFDVFFLDFDVVGQAGGTVTITPIVTAAGNESGTDISSLLSAQALTLSIN